MIFSKKCGLLAKLTFGYISTVVDVVDSVDSSLSRHKHNAVMKIDKLSTYDPLSAEAEGSVRSHDQHYTNVVVYSMYHVIRNTHTHTHKQTIW